MMMMMMVMMMMISFCMATGGGTHQFNLNGYLFDSGLHYTGRVGWSVLLYRMTYNSIN